MLSHRGQRFYAAAILSSSLLVLSACSDGSAQSTPAAAARTAPQPVAVSRGTLLVNVNSSGTFTSQTSSKLAFGSSGKITEVNVKIGDKVTKGKVLARIDDTQLKQAVTQAEWSLKIAQSKLDTMLAGSRSEEIFSARAALEAAKAKLAEMTAGSKQEEIDIARLNLSVAQANLDKVKAGPTASEMAAAQAAVVSAEANLKIAENNLVDLKASPKPSDVLQAQATYDSATASLASALANQATVLAGPTQSEILAAQNSLDQAHTSAIQADIAAQVPQGQDPLGRLRAAQVAAHTSEAAAQSRLDDLMAKPTATEIAAAKTQVDQATANQAIAKAKLDLLLAGPTASEMLAAENSVANAKSSVVTAKAKLDDLKKSPLAQDVASAEVSVLNAQLQLQAKLSPYTANEIKQQENAVTQAEHALALKLNPYTEADFLQSRSTVEQAKLSLDNAVTALANAPIIAPFDGVVASVAANLGESSSGASVQIVNPALLKLDITVDELDVAKVKPGQQAAITMDSQAGKVFRGTVQAVSPQGATTQGVTSYQATLAVALPEGTVLGVGSSASVRIIVDSKQDVLVVPRNALRTVGRTQVVQVVDDKGLTVDRTVRIGLTNDLQAEVLEGLQEGEKVMARPVSGGGGGGVIIPPGLFQGQGGPGGGGLGGPGGGVAPAGGFGGGAPPQGGPGAGGRR